MIAEGRPHEGTRRRFPPRARLVPAPPLAAGKPHTLCPLPRHPDHVTNPTRPTRKAMHSHADTYTVQHQNSRLPPRAKGEPHSLLTTSRLASDQPVSQRSAVKSNIVSQPASQPAAAAATRPPFLLRGTNVCPTQPLGRSTSTRVVVTRDHHEPPHSEQSSSGPLPRISFIIFAPSPPAARSSAVGDATTSHRDDPHAHHACR